MSNFSNSRLLSTVAVLVALPGIWAQGQSVTASVGIVNDAVAEGQPVILALEFKNESSETAYIDLGRHFEEHVSASVLAPNGQTLAKANQDRGGLSGAGAVEVAAGGSSKVLYLVSDWFPAFAKGTYRLRVGVPPYARGDVGARIPILQPEEIEVRVAAHESADAKAMSARFFSVIQSGNYDNAKVAATALVLMGDSVAVPYLVATIRQKPLLDTTVIQGLAHFPDNEDAVDTLIYFLREGGFHAMLARIALESITNSATRPDLIRRIGVALGNQ
jgi:hypothetical protein